MNRGGIGRALLVTLLLWIASAGLVGAYLRLAGPPKPNRVSPSSPAEAAYLECRDVARAELHESASPEFPSSATRVNLDDAAGVGRVAAFVDARNGRGVRRRMSFECQMKRSGSDWTVKRIVFDEAANPR